MKNETNTQHTKGEWVIINSEKLITVTTRAFGAICEIPHGGKAIEEHTANAQLIARAPELLEALKGELSERETTWDADDADSSTHKAILKLKTLIAKAEGKILVV